MSASALEEPTGVRVHQTVREPAARKSCALRTPWTPQLTRPKVEQQGQGWGQPYIRMQIPTFRVVMVKMG